MMNQLAIIGRLVENPILQKNKDKNGLVIILNVPKSHKNIDGKYDSDLIPVKVSLSIAKSMCEYCHKGDLVGIKGHLEYDNNKLEAIVEKLTFLTSKKADE